MVDRYRWVDRQKVDGRHMRDNTQMNDRQIQMGGQTEGGQKTR